MSPEEGIQARARAEAEKLCLYHRGAKVAVCQCVAYTEAFVALASDEARRERERHCTRSEAYVHGGHFCLDCDREYESRSRSSSHLKESLAREGEKLPKEAEIILRSNLSKLYEGEPVPGEQGQEDCAQTETRPFCPAGFAEADHVREVAPVPAPEARVSPEPDTMYHTPRCAIWRGVPCDCGPHTAIPRDSE